ncbi:unnamed protein product, partial [Rotaria magnacalcarata]
MLFDSIIISLFSFYFNFKRNNTKL